MSCCVGITLYSRKLSGGSTSSFFPTITENYKKCDVLPHLETFFYGTYFGALKETKAAIIKSSFANCVLDSNFIKGIGSHSHAHLIIIMHYKANSVRK